MELRRPRSLIAYWHDGGLAIQNYLTRKPEGVESIPATRVNGAAVEVLSLFDDWMEPESAAHLLDGYAREEVLAAVKELHVNGLLQTREQAERDEALDQHWKNWGPEARLFLFGTKDVTYLAEEVSDVSRREAEKNRILESGPRPEIFSRHPDAPVLRLPQAYLPLRREYEETITSRRTHREFLPDPVPLRTFSTVLHFTFGPMFFADGEGFGTLMMRTSPCAGSRHENECYVAVLNVEGIQPGLYHYSPADHSLVALREEITRESVQRLAFGQRMVGTAGFVCFLTAKIERSSYKYRQGRILRAIFLNAGHLGQTFLLTATAAGLGPFQTDAFRDSEIEEFLGIDGISETVLYIVGAGIPAGRTDGLPPQIPIASKPTPQKERR